MTMTSIERREIVTGIEADIEDGNEGGPHIRCRVCWDVIDYDDLEAWIPKGLCYWCNEFDEAQSRDLT